MYTLLRCTDSAVAPRLADGGVCSPRTAQTNRLSSTRLLCSAVAPRLADGGVTIWVGGSWDLVAAGRDQMLLT